MSSPDLSTPLDFTHEQLAARVVFGAGRRRDVPGEVRNLGPSAVLIIGGAHDVETVEQLKRGCGVPTETIIGVRPHVPFETVRDALDIFDRVEPGVVVTVGGGSATGLGKMVARERDVTLVAVPTTYAGSEMTPIWGTTEAGAKQTGRSPRVLPSIVVYDPELTLGLPRKVTVNSAFNALAHCVEALWLADTSPITTEAAVGAIRSIVGSVGAVADRPDDIEARAGLLYGAHRAGTVLASAGTGLLHKTAHVLGGMFDLDHGSMYAVLTPHMVGHHFASIPAARPALIESLGPDPQAALDALAIRLGAPLRLAEIGFPEDRRREVAEAVADSADVAVDEIETLLHAATGRAPERNPS